jgi:hypothetical protein
MNRIDYVTYVLLFYPIVLDIYCRKEPTTVNLTTSNVALLPVPVAARSKA